MASFRVVEENISPNRVSIDKSEVLNEVQTEINDLLPSWDHRQFENRTGLANKIDMEEGELSGDETHDIDFERSMRKNNSSDFNLSRRQPIQITIQNKDAAKLPVSLSIY